MIEKISLEQVRQISEIAKAAHKVRDLILEKIAEEDLGEPKPAKGEHDAAAAMGFESLPPDHPALSALVQAIRTLEPEARQELCALMWIGRGDHAPKDWVNAVAQAATMADEAIAGLLAEEPDLSGLVMKALYELKLI